VGQSKYRTVVGVPRRRARGAGSISRRKDGRYEGRISLGLIDGKRVRKTIYGNSRVEVAQKLQHLSARLIVGSYALRLDTYIDTWLVDGRSRWEPQTHRTYSTWLNTHVAPYLGKRKIVDITPSDIKAWMRQLEERGVGASTRSRALKTLRSALKDLVDEELLFRNPCDPVKGPKVRRKPFHVPRPHEMKVLLDSAEPLWLFALILLAFTATMREGEMFALYWSQVDLLEGSIFVDRSLAEDWNKVLIRKDPKTEYSIRTIFLPSVTTSTLSRLKQAQLHAGYEGPWVFPDSSGGPLRKSNFIRRHWRPLLEKAGLPYFKFYAERHAGNSLLIAQGENALAIARRMGQADTRMAFDVYGHLFDDAGRRSASRMEQGLKQYGILEDPDKLAEEHPAHQEREGEQGKLEGM